MVAVEPRSLSQLLLGQPFRDASGPHSPTERALELGGVIVFLGWHMPLWVCRNRSVYTLYVCPTIYWPLRCAPMRGIFTRAF